MIFLNISQTLNTTIQQQLERIVRKELQAGIEKLTKDIVQTVEGALLRNLQEVLKKSMQGVIPKTDALFKDALDKSLPHMRYKNLSFIFNFLFHRNDSLMYCFAVRLSPSLCDSLSNIHSYNTSRIGSYQLLINHARSCLTS